MDTSTSVPLSVTDAAKHARCSTKTIRRWLTSGRLQASRGADGAWLIDVDDLEHAIATPGLATDSPTLATRHGQDMSIVQELLNRLERQAAEIVTLRLERDQARQQVLALETRPEPAPRVAYQYTTESDPNRIVEIPTPRRAWWQVWRRATV